MATYRKPLKDIDGNFIIPAMTGDQTGWIQTGDIADNAVTAPKINWTTAGATQILTGEDLHDVKFLKPGKYCARTNAIAGTLLHCPDTSAFDMWVTNTLGSETDFSDMSGWYYVNRVIMTYHGRMYVQGVNNGGTSTWSFGSWIPLASRVSAGAYTSVNTTYVNSVGSSNTVFRMGSLVVVNINLQMKAGTVPTGTALINNLPSCNSGYRACGNMVGANGSGARLQIAENGTSIIADGAFTATAQWYNGQITYLSY